MNTPSAWGPLINVSKLTSPSNANPCNLLKNEGTRTCILNSTGHKFMNYALLFCVPNVYCCADNANGIDKKHTQKAFIIFMFFHIDFRR